MELEIDRYAALLFDLDGTLVDTMPLHYRAYARVLAARGLLLTEPAYMAQVGAPAREAIPRFLAACGHIDATADDVATIHAEKKRVFEASLAGAALEPLAAFALLQAAQGRVRTALVSSGNRAGVTAIVAAMDWAPLFELIVSGDDVVRGKPDPEPYLLAAERLGVHPATCLVLEDTADGLRSGHAAGMATVDVTRAWHFS